MNKELYQGKFYQNGGNGLRPGIFKLNKDIGKNLRVVVGETEKDKDTQRMDETMKRELERGERTQGEQEDEEEETTGDGSIEAGNRGKEEDLERKRGREQKSCKGRETGEAGRGGQLRMDVDPQKKLKVLKLFTRNWKGDEVTEEEEAKAKQKVGAGRE